MRSRNVDFGCAIAIVGLLAGFAGLATTLLLRSIEHLTYHYTFGTLLDGVTASSTARQAVGPTIGGALAGFGWWILRSRADVPPLAVAVAHRERIRLWPFTFDAALQVLVVGSGASLGREVAPRQFAVALSNLVTGWLKTAVRTRPRDPAGVCGRGRTGSGVRGAARWGVVHPAHHVEELASARGGSGADHVRAWLFPCRRW